MMRNYKIEIIILGIIVSAVAFKFTYMSRPIEVTRAPSGGDIRVK